MLHEHDRRNADWQEIKFNLYTMLTGRKIFFHPWTMITVVLQQT
mgnify:CR=1 FL=1